METKGSEMKSQMELRWKQRKPRWNPRWNSDGSKGIRDGIRDGIPDGTQMEAKEFKIDSHDRIQVIQVIQVIQGIPEEMPETKKTGHNWSVFKIYRELNDYSATTSNEKVPFTFL